MSTPVRAIAASLLLSLAACASAPDVEINTVPGAQIGVHSTFQVIPDRRDSPLGPMRTRELRVRIEKALGDEMQRLGYRQVEENGDIRVEYVTYVTEEYETEHRKEYKLGPAVIDQHLPPPRDVPLRVGTLHVHLLHDGKALYEGIASGVVNGDVSAERIRRGVRALLAKVPGGPLMDGKRPVEE